MEALYVHDSYASLFPHRLDRAPESVVSRLPARIWTGSGWEKEGDWLKKMKIRGQRAQVEEQIRIAKDHETGINPRLSVTIDERILPDDGVAVTSPNDLEAGVLAINIPSTTLGDDHQETSSTRAPSSDSDDLPETRQPWFQGQSECVRIISIVNIQHLSTHLYFSVGYMFVTICGRRQGADTALRSLIPR